MITKKQFTVLALSSLMFPAMYIYIDRRPGSEAVFQAGEHDSLEAMGISDKDLENCAIPTEETNSLGELGIRNALQVVSGDTENAVDLGAESNSIEVDILGDRIEALFESSLLSTPPDRSAVEQVVAELSDNMEIVDSSLQYDEEGKLVSGLVHIAGTELRGEFIMDGENVRIDIPVKMPKLNHFFSRSIGIGIIVEDGVVMGGTTVIQHNPNTLQEAAAPPAGRDPFVCGWVLTTVDGAGSFDPIEAKFNGKANGWSIGRLGNFGSELYPGYSHMVPFDSIHKDFSGKFTR